MFDKDICLKNIYYLAKSKDVKIGDIEKAVPVSSGYFSRLGKEDNKSVPGVDVIATSAKMLGVPMDLLISTDFSELTPTEKYIHTFLEKIIKNTTSGTYQWQIDMPSMKNLARSSLDQDNSQTHKFMKPVDRYAGADYAGTFLEYHSEFFPEEDFRVKEDCYFVSVGDTSYLYITKTIPTVYDSWNGDDEEIMNYELYLYSEIDTQKINPICTGSTMLASNPQSQFFNSLKSLYTLAAESARHVKINSTVKDAIDAIMSDKKVDELPF